MGSDELIDVEKATPQQHKAAAKIQARQRGKKDREKVKKLKEEKKKAKNPKIGDVAPGGGLVGAANKKATDTAEQSLELLLQMFGKDGGAYMRKNEQRSCRDMPMLISFSLYWLCMLYIVNHATEEGDIDKLFYPVTFGGTSCGVKGMDPVNDVEVDLTDFQSIYYPEPTLPEYNFCVRDCPGDEKKSPVTTVPDIMDTQAPFSSYICHHDIELQGRYGYGRGPGSNKYTDSTCQLPSDFLGLTNFAPEGETGRERACNWLQAVCGGGNADPTADSMCSTAPQTCAPTSSCGAMFPPMTETGMAGCFHPYGKTLNVLYQCIPIQLAENATQMIQEMSGDLGSQHFLDLQDFGWVVGLSFGLALLLSFVWIIFLDYFAGPLIWTTVYLSIIILPSIGVVMQYKAGTITPPSELAVPPDVQTKMAEVQVDPTLAQNAAYACYIGTVVLIAVFCIFKDRITLSIGVIEEASDCFLAIPKAIALPILTFVAELPLVAYAAYSTLQILSLRTYDADAGGYVYDDALKQMLAFNAFGILWAGYILISIQYTTIAGAASDWYFTFPDSDGDRNIAMFAVERSFFRVLRYNLGTMIFGALLIAVVVVAKWIATYFINQVMRQSPENKVILILGHCLICVVNCIEKFVRFLGKLAYIECAIYGSNFCNGIYNASKRLLKNIVRFSFLSVFAHIMIFLGKCGVVAGTVLACEVIIAAHRDPEKDFDVPYAPLVCCATAAALTVSLVMSVYETAIDTIMLCFLEDEAENDAKGKPSFASGELAGFMKNTKSISDAVEQYNEDTRQAKTNKIRADKKTDEKLKSSHAGIRAAHSGKSSGRSARSRKSDKGGKGNDETNDATKYSNPMSEEE